MLPKIEKVLSKIKEVPGLNEIIEGELVNLRDIDKDIGVLLDSGLALYQLGDPGLFTTAIHSGSALPKDLPIKQSKEERKKEEDLFTDDLYLPIFLENGGFLIKSFFSRYFVDLNKSKNESVLQYQANNGTNLVDETKKELWESQGHNFRRNFYNRIKYALDYSDFVVNGHSMCDRNNRPDICIVTKNNGEQLKKYFEDQGFIDVKINDPFSGGELHRFCQKYSKSVTDIEINKKLYMNEKTQKKLPNFDETSNKINNAIYSAIQKL